MKQIIAKGDVLVINEVVAMELLAGKRITDNHEVDRIVNNTPSLALDVNIDFRKAGNLFAEMRKSGITVRNTSDCLIAVNVMNHENVVLLHSDNDYVQIAQHTSLKHEVITVQ